MNAKINIDNYEAWWVDYLDGNLSPEQEEKLFDFLELNPDIAVNLVDADSFVLSANEVLFPAKENLKAENQIENLLIAKLENEISKENDNYITEKIQNNNAIAAVFSLYQKTILEPDNKVVFKGKKYLKKSTISPLYRNVSSIAAILAVVFVAGYFLTRNTVVIDNTNSSQFAQIGVTKPIKDTLESIVDEDNKIETIQNKVLIADNNFIEAEITDVNYIQKLDIPSKLNKSPIANLEYKQKTSVGFDIMAYRYDLPKEEPEFAYSMQIIQTPKENRFKTAINKVYQFGKDVNLKEHYDNLKLAKEELLFTSK